MSLTREVLPNRGDSTSPGLSSPPSPNSPAHYSATPTSLPPSLTTSFAQNHDGNETSVGGLKSGRATAARATSVVKRPRKKKDSENNPGTVIGPNGQEKPRQRAVRGTSEAFKKKQAKAQAEKEAQAIRDAEALRQTKTSDAIPPASLPPAHFDVPAIHAPAENGNHEAIPTTQIHPSPRTTPQARPTTSGQNYDPIRSSTVAPRPTSPLPTPATPQKPYNKTPSASASPSIHSLIDAPDSMPRYNFTQLPKRENEGKSTSPPDPKRPRLSPPIPLPSQQHHPLITNDTGAAAPTTRLDGATAMDVDTDKATVPALANNVTSVIKKPSPKGSTAVSSSSHSPKPGRSKEAPITISSGSGLLSGAIFGGGLDSSGPEKSAPTVVLNVRLDGDNQYVNFTKLAEERYGFNALHPRLASQRERLARVAAAGAALENAHKNGGISASGDEMSVDLSDGDADNSNVEMLDKKSGEDTGEGPLKKPRKRITKEDMYDKEDDFIDDTELIWEEQAATSKDGFFVYSGPLIPPGQQPEVERYDFNPIYVASVMLTQYRATAQPKRGRTSARARGSTRGGARGGAAKDGTKAPARKSRTTKAEKEQLEREKAQRENLAVLASKPTGYQIPA
ncbi:hypothetical protein MMC21_001896 [Puttea exsequens]|nr:hypothetical protein [Puttea exsequens]